MPRKVASRSLPAEFQDLKSKAAARVASSGRLQLDGRRQDFQTDETSQLRQTLSIKLEHIEKSSSHQRASALKEIDACMARVKKRMKFEMQNCAKIKEDVQRECNAFLEDCLEDKQSLQTATKQLQQKVHSAGNSLNEVLRVMADKHNHQLQSLGRSR